MEGKPIDLRPLVVVAILGVLAGVFWFAYLRDRTPAITPDEAKEKAATFLDEIRAGRVDNAWAGTSADFKSMYGRERFRQYVKSKPVLKRPAEFEACEFKTEGDLRTAECTFRSSSGKGSIKVVLNVDEGVWKVGRLSVE
jgi:hypothetical protein